ncbi:MULTISPECIES: polysaccharide biosynthesis C-terminal domain-containing protein [unclassified Pseudoalteromonas]|jgi:O-antigen/teichoic acid export membrane protein|uniref:oligosaccharide flippase family protein n=1 Tax=unclassified Pseudoalteromonas TaxID=194690 RepID=UPI001C0024D0|nr:polysaccharide biosynthesis C-terminal domain-containing protein [Pseudoalteromonas sp. SiA1]QWF33146.1 polysaccharide biosynthesis C-terminal domain-containing protein [Pseudoalteromonas sp. SiA1]
MKSQKFIAGLFKRKAQWVLSSSLMTKFTGLLLSLIVVRLLTVEDYGVITLYKTIFLFLIPLIGLGLNHSLLRFGAIASSASDKVDFLLNAVFFGISASLVIGVIFFIILPFVPNLYFSSSLFISVYSFYQGLYILNCIFNFYRITNNNKSYSLASASFSLLTLIITSTAVYLYQTPTSFFTGQLISILVFLLLLICLKQKQVRDYSFNFVRALSANAPHLKYGLSVAFGGLASQLMLASDNIMLSIMGESLSSIGLYGVCSLIFVNALFIPSVILITDFVYLSNLSLHKVKSYLFEYWKFIIVPLLSVCISFILWGDVILSFLFGDIYTQAAKTLQILSLGIFFGVMFRVPIGNLLNAKGLASFNVCISLIFALVNIVLNYILIPLYGINGAAWATVCTICISSAISLFYLLYKLQGKV